MKKIYISILTIYFGLSAFAQTSVQNGNWMNPTTWDCLCVPNPFFTAIDITVNHTVTSDINNGGLYFAGGSLTIGPNGTLLQSGDGDLFMKNATTIVDGILDMRRVAIEGGISTYNGTIQNCDSLWNDSSVVINNGTIVCYDHQVYPMGEMTNNGYIHMTNNMNNQGLYINGASGIILIDNDFSNANTFGGRAMFSNIGDHQVVNNFTNTANDTILGTGTFCIGNLSSNLGTVLGTLTFTTLTGGFNFNSGFIAPSVNFIPGNCSMNLNESEMDAISIYPNPFTDILTIKGINQIDNIELFGINGKLIQAGITNNTTVNLSGLEAGVYFLKITDSDNVSLTRKIVKQ